MVKLYHYTDTEGKDAIEATGVIRRSGGNYFLDDAQFGPGVYFTSIRPRNQTRVILGNNWDGLYIPDYMKYRTEWYFEFDFSELYDVEQIPTKRDIWLVRNRDVVCYKTAGHRYI